MVFDLQQRVAAGLNQNIGIGKEARNQTNAGRQVYFSSPSAGLGQSGTYQALSQNIQTKSVREALLQILSYCSRVVQPTLFPFDFSILTHGTVAVAAHKSSLGETGLTRKRQLNRSLPRLRLADPVGVPYPPHYFMICRIPSQSPWQPLEPPTQEKVRPELLPGVVFCGFCGVGEL